MRQTTFRWFHVVLLQELGVGEEAQWNDADAGPVIVGIAQGGVDRVRVGRTIGFEDAFLAGGGIHVGRIAHHDVDLRVALFCGQTSQCLTRGKAKECASSA